MDFALQNRGVDMIRVIFESKYIRVTLLVVCVLVAVFCVAASWRGEYIRTEKMQENIYDERGDYIIVEQNDVYTVKNKEGEALYTALGLYPEFTDKEGYIIDTTSPGRSGVVNFLTGEVVYETEEEDSIVVNRIGFWIVETQISDGGMGSAVYYYLLDDNFEIAMNGLMLNDWSSTEDYIYGQMLVNENYYNKEELSKYKVFGPHPDIEHCVINREGEIVYTSDEYIYEMEGDRVVIQDEEGDYVYVDIYTGEKEDAGNEYY